MIDLDKWAEQPKISRKLIFVADDYVHPLNAVSHIDDKYPDGYRPETDVEFRERITNAN